MQDCRNRYIQPDLFELGQGRKTESPEPEQCSGPAEKERPTIMLSGESNNLLRGACYMFLYDVYERMHIAIHYSIVSVTSRSVRLLFLTTRASMRISSSSVSLPFPLIIG